jgi:L-lactate utilization protein LutC
LVTAPPSSVERLREALIVNRCGVDGPLTSDAAATRVAEVAMSRAAGGPIALPTRDAGVAALELDSRLGALGAHLLHPDDPDWHDRLPGAAVGVTSCAVAVAATGTLAMVAGPGCPRATSLVPAAHICIVRVADVVDELADAIARFAAGPLPSAVSWVGGPSRTSDLEMRTTFGVHGPKTVDVVIFSADPADPADSAGTLAE